MIDKEWLKRKIETDPDCEVEAGTMHPEAPMTHDTDALVSELISNTIKYCQAATPTIQAELLGPFRASEKALLDAIERLTRERDEARTESLTNFIAAGQAARLAETAEAALSAARAELALMSKQLSWCLHELRSMHFIRLVNDGMKVKAAEIQADSDIGQFRAHRHISAQPAEFDPSALKEAPHE